MMGLQGRHDPLQSPQPLRFASQTLCAGSRADTLSPVGSSPRLGYANYPACAGQAVKDRPYCLAPTDLGTRVVAGQTRVGCPLDVQLPPVEVPPFLRFCAMLVLTVVLTLPRSELQRAP